MLENRREELPMLHIDRCYCFQQRFCDLHAAAEAAGAQTVADLQACVVFGQKCQLCHPYVRRMLRTGEIVFHEILREADEPDAVALKVAA